MFLCLISARSDFSRKTNVLWIISDIALRNFHAQMNNIFLVRLDSERLGILLAGNAREMSQDGIQQREYCQDKWRYVKGIWQRNAKYIQFFSCSPHLCLRSATYAHVNALHFWRTKQSYRF